MDMDTSYFCTCTPAEIKLLNALADEMPSKIKLKYLETPHSFQIIIHTENRSIRDYVYVVLKQHRERVKELERLYQKG